MVLVCDNLNQLSRYHYLLMIGQTSASCDMNDEEAYHRGRFAMRTLVHSSRPHGYWVARQLCSLLYSQHDYCTMARPSHLYGSVMP
jgi:hypothetical protein